MTPLLWRDTLLAWVKPITPAPPIGPAPEEMNPYLTERGRATMRGRGWCQVCGAIGQPDPISTDLLCSRCRVRFSVYRWLVWEER